VGSWWGSGHGGYGRGDGNRGGHDGRHGGWGGMLDFMSRRGQR